jgi:hypothetical protein
MKGVTILCDTKLKAGHTITQANCRQLITSEPGFKSGVNSLFIWGGGGEVGKVAVGQVCLRVLRFSAVN